METKEVKTCLSCKITSILCLSVIGGYLCYQGKVQKSGSSKYPLLCLGLGCIALGVGEIFNKSPFRPSK